MSVLNGSTVVPAAIEEDTSQYMLDGRLKNYKNSYIRVFELFILYVFWDRLLLIVHFSTF